MCVSVTALVIPLKAKVRYHQKALDVGNKLRVGIELNISIIGLKVMSN